MKYFFTYIAVLIIIATTTGVYAQQQVIENAAPKKTGFKDFVSKFQLRKSFQSVKDKESDAFVNLVFPKESESSQNFAFALSYSIETNLSAFKPFIEWQRNTVTDKKQNTFLAGLTFRTYGWDLLANDTWVPTIIATANYKHDNIKSTEGAQASAYFSPVFYNKAEPTFYPVPGARNSNGVMSFDYNIYIGTEFESRSQVLVASHKGDVWRGYGRITGNFYPAPNVFDERIELVPDFTYRYAFSNKSTAEKDINHFLKLSANIVLAKKSKSGLADVKIGYDYVKGSDPTAGFDQQNVNTITLKLKI